MTMMTMMMMMMTLMIKCQTMWPWRTHTNKGTQTNDKYKTEKTKISALKYG